MLERVTEIVNEITPWLQFTGATTGPAPGTLVAMLDAQMEIEHTPEGKMICFKYFKKTCASQLVIMCQSVMSLRQKIQMLANELI